MSIQRAFDSQTQIPEQLYDWLFGPIRWQLLELALTMELFDALIEPLEASTIALQFNTKPRETALLLNALSSLGLLHKDSSKDSSIYQLPTELAPYLTKHSKYSMRAMLLHLSQVRHQDAKSIEKILKTGHSDHSSGDICKPEFWENSFNSLNSFHHSLGIALILPLLTSLAEWPRVHKFLDLGAGSTALAEALIQQRDDVAVTLFDLPASVRVLKQNLNAHGRISLLAGNYNQDTIGQGYDLIWASMSLYFAEDLSKLLAKISQALNPGGIFVSFHEALTCERTQPEKHVIGRLIPALSGSDLSFDDDVIASAMQAAGFAVESRYVPCCLGEMRLDVGRLLEN